jgi:uncharacterized repeat protein (TIGR03803 family)
MLKRTILAIAAFLMGLRLNESSRGSIMWNGNSKHALRALVFLASCEALIPAAANGSACAAETETVLHTFLGGSDGANPLGGLIADGSGNLYGTTTKGAGVIHSFGTVFKIDQSGNLTPLHSFNGSDGANPIGDLILSSGNLFGIASQGGLHNGEGVVFKLTPDGSSFNVLYNFCSQPNCADGGLPAAGLIADSSGNLYGTTTQFGANGLNGHGVVFEIPAGGNYSVLYNFCSQPNCTDGSGPSGGLFLDSLGNLYGATSGGGTNGEGVVFEIPAGGNYSVLYNFCSQPNCTDGAGPVGDLIADSSGNLYGTTDIGGSKASPCNSSGCGVVFKLAFTSPPPPPCGGLGEVCCPPARAELKSTIEGAREHPLRLPIPPFGTCNNPDLICAGIICRCKPGDVCSVP